MMRPLTTSLLVFLCLSVAPAATARMHELMLNPDPCLGQIQELVHKAGEEARSPRVAGLLRQAEETIAIGELDFENIRWHLKRVREAGGDISTLREIEMLIEGEDCLS